MNHRAHREINSVVSVSSVVSCTQPKNALAGRPQRTVTSNHRDHRDPRERAVFFLGVLGGESPVKNPPADTRAVLPAGCVRWPPERRDDWDAAPGGPGVLCEEW